MVGAGVKAAGGMGMVVGRPVCGNGSVWSGGGCPGRNSGPFWPQPTRQAVSKTPTMAAPRPWGLNDKAWRP